MVSACTDRAAASTSDSEPAALSELRRRAADAFAELPIPVIKDKGWEHTDLSRLDLDTYQPIVAGANELGTPDATELPDGVVVLPLAEAAASHTDLVTPHLGTLVLDGDKFAAQNGAKWRDGVFIYVPANTKVEQPISLETVQKIAGSAQFWRVLIVLAEGAKLTVAEHFLSAEPDLDAYFNPVAEIFIGAGARLNYLCIQNLSERSWILGNQRARIERDGDLQWVTLGLGSGQGKLRMETDLRGRGANACVTGAYTAHSDQHLDFDTTQEHFAPDTTSDLAFRGILLDRATAVWSGMIRVEPDAQRTDAFQESRSLLLSNSAHADAIPGLEIEANDVRCTHAATLGRIDRDLLFYLMSRGLTHSEAERLIVSGFLEVVSARLKDSEFMHGAVSTALDEQLQRILSA